jgi:hypothetical protein
MVMAATRSSSQQLLLVVVPSAAGSEEMVDRLLAADRLAAGDSLPVRSRCRPSMPLRFWKGGPTKKYISIPRFLSLSLFRFNFFARQWRESCSLTHTREGTSSNDCRLNVAQGVCWLVQVTRKEGVASKGTCCRPKLAFQTYPCMPCHQSPRGHLHGAT